MKKIGIFYGSTLGTTQLIAQKIGDLLGIEEVHDIADSTDKIENYEFLIFGTNTWGYGDIQDDWSAAERAFKSLDLSNKKVAIYGTGDQTGYPDTFVDGMGILKEWVENAKGVVVGYTSIDGYNFTASRSELEGRFCGLAIDETNQSNLTDLRVKNWIEVLRGEFGITV